MKEYYLERLHWIFNYTSKKFFYCLLKTLCLVVGIPIYVVAFVIEMVFTAINMIFCWIPILGVVITVICKSIVWLFGNTFYINILTDLKAYKKAHVHVVEYEVEDAQDEAENADEVENANEAENENKAENAQDIEEK